MQPTYNVSNEYNVSELLANFDEGYILDSIENRLENINFASNIIDSNVIASFEVNFKLMNQNFPGDSQNIKNKRLEIYLYIIDMLCKKFNLEFNDSDENIIDNIYTAVFYLYDFLVCNRNNLMTTFFTQFILCNADNIYNCLNLDEYRKQKDSLSIYNRKIYNDENYKYAIISANIKSVIDHISSFDITLDNIFQTVYPDPNVVQFMSLAFADRGNFFRDFYCSVLYIPDTLPVVMTNIRLELQRIVGGNLNPLDDILAQSNQDNGGV